MFPSGYRYQNRVTGNQLHGGSQGISLQNTGRSSGASASPQKAGIITMGAVNPMDIIAVGGGGSNNVVLSDRLLFRVVFATLPL